MKKCKYCRTKFSGDACPKCGAMDGIEIIEKRNDNIIDDNNIFDSISSNPNIPINLYGNIISKAQQVAYNVKFVIKVWAVCFILGSILSIFIKKGNFAFIEENKDILEYVKFALLYLGGIIGYLLLKLKRFIRK